MRRAHANEHTEELRFFLFLELNFIYMYIYIYIYSYFSIFKPTHIKYPYLPMCFVKGIVKSSAEAVQAAIDTVI